MHVRLVQIEQAPEQWTVHKVCGDKSPEFVGLISVRAAKPTMAKGSTGAFRAEAEGCSKIMEKIHGHDHCAQTCMGTITARRHARLPSPCTAPAAISTAMLEPVEVGLCASVQGLEDSRYTEQIDYKSTAL